jgi:hypothetical protein
MHPPSNWKTRRIKRNHEKLLQSAVLEKQAEQEVPMPLKETETQERPENARAVMITTVLT